MPERDKQTDAMARTLAGAGPRPFRDRLGTRPADVTETEWDDAQTMADLVYVDLVEAIDFQRVLIEANKRHLTVHPDKSTMLAAADIGVMHSESLCGECLTEVLLATATNPPWTEEPESPRYLRYSPEQFVATLDPYTALGLNPPDDPDSGEDDWVPPTSDGPADRIADAETASWLARDDRP